MERILCWSRSALGIEQWTLGIDSDARLAQDAIAPLKRKLIIAAVLMLAFALVAVSIIAGLAGRRAKIEQQNRYLRIADAQRGKLDFIYRFAQELLAADIQGRIFGRIADAIKTVAAAPFAMAWHYDAAIDAFVPANTVMDDHRLSEQIRASGVDIAQLRMPNKIDDTDMRELGGHIVMPLQKLETIGPSWTLLTHSLSKLFAYTHMVVVSLKLRDKLFGCLVVPCKAEAPTQAELVESFRLAVGQVLYIRAILAELMTNNRIQQDILNTVDKAIFLVDSNFAILSASPVFYRIFDVKGEAIGKNLFEVVQFLRDLHQEEVYREVIRTKSVVETEETYFSPDKNRRFTRTKIIPIAGEGEMVERILTIVDNVTEFRLLEEQLRHTANELTQKNRQLQKQAITDELTQLRNYRYFMEQLPVYIDRHRAAGQTFALVSMDIDDFKRYNDTYGHLAGDRLLVEVSDIVRGFLRSGDLAARYGGDEFVLVLSDTGKDEAMDTAQRLCSRISRAVFLGAQGIRSEHITVSIGIAEFTDDIIEGEDLLRRSDAALYASKQSGKRRVTAYSADLRAMR